MTQYSARVAISTLIIARCIHHVRGEIFHALMHQPRRLKHCVERALDNLSTNARRAHPERDRRTGRTKLGLQYVYDDA